jgi:hypothetical protein
MVAAIDLATAIERVHRLRKSTGHGGPALLAALRRMNMAYRDQAIFRDERFCSDGCRQGAHAGIGKLGHRACPCRKQISSGNTPGRRYSRPPAPKPTRTGKVCSSLRGPGRKRRYWSGLPQSIVTARLRPVPRNSRPSAAAARREKVQDRRLGGLRCRARFAKKNNG